MSFLGRWLSRILPVRPLQRAAESESAQANDELALSRLPFRPYQVEQNDQREWVIRRENRLRDAIRDTYLKNVVMWLLGYDARYPLQEQIDDTPLRAQQSHSPWQTAWNIRTLVQARPLLVREHPKLVSEIDRKLARAIPWLLDQKCEHKEGLAHWEQRKYDTGIVVTALLMLMGDYPALDRTLVKKTKTTVISGLRWLAAEIHGQSLANDPTTRSGMEVLALAMARKYLKPVECRTTFAQYDNYDTVLILAVQEYLQLLETESSIELTKEKDDIENGEESPYAENSRAVALSWVLKVATSTLQPALVARVKEILVQGIQHVERRAEKDDWEDPASRAHLLLGYVAAVQTVQMHTMMEEKVIVQCLHYFSGHNTFEDGSIYHDLYATTYFAECLVAVHNSWLGAKPLVAIYNDLLKGRDQETIEAREQIFGLERRLIAAERQYSQLDAEAMAIKRHNKQLRRLLLLFFVGLVLSVVATVWIMPWLGIGGLGPYVNSDQTEAFLALAGLVAGLTAALVTAIEIIFFRDERDRG